MCVSCSVSQSCLTLGNPTDQNPPGSRVHGISQARTLEQVAISSCRGASRPRDRTCASCLLHWQAGSSPRSHLGRPSRSYTTGLKTGHAGFPHRPAMVSSALHSLQTPQATLPTNLRGGHHPLQVGEESPGDLPRGPTAESGNRDWDACWPRLSARPFAGQRLLPGRTPVVGPGPGSAPAIPGAT